MSETTFIEESKVYVCNNCGAHAASPGDIQHFDNCSPGEAERWKKMYNDSAEEEATWLEKVHDEDDVAYLEAEKTEETWWEKHYDTILD